MHENERKDRRGAVRKSSSADTEPPRRRGPTRQPSPGGPYMDVRQIAAEFGLSESAVREALRLGILRGRQVGRSWRVRRAWVDQWFAEIEQAPRETLDAIVKKVREGRRRARRTRKKNGVDVGGATGAGSAEEDLSA